MVVRGGGGVRGGVRGGGGGGSVRGGVSGVRGGGGGGGGGGVRGGLWLFSVCCGAALVHRPLLKTPSNLAPISHENLKNIKHLYNELLPTLKKKKKKEMEEVREDLF